MMVQGCGSEASASSGMPGVADAMRFWHLTRPVPGSDARKFGDSDSAR